MRLIITVLVLIVLPTALLSVLAGRSIQAREVILERRLAQEASARLDEVAAQVERRISEALTEITRMFRDTMLAGREVKRIEQARMRNAGSSDTVLQSFLFMNPWEFMFPDPALDDAATPPGLQQALTRALADGAARGRGRIMFAVESRIFCFEPVPDYSDLYAGMELDIPGMMRFMEGLLEEQTSPLLQFSVLTVDPLEQWIPDADVLVSDSLEMRVESAPAVSPVRRWNGVLASRRLHAPLAHIEIGVAAVAAADVRQAYRLQERLTVWGILLLAVVISGSAALLIAGALRQAGVASRRSGLMAGMSHDLRTPVSAMRVLAESLRAGRVGDESRRIEFLEAIIAECDRLGDLIERVMFYFRQEQGAMRYEKALVEADALAAGVAERFRRQHAGRVRFRITAEDHVPPVRADVNALEKALTNLIDNAVKYGRRPGGGSRAGDGGEDAADVDVHTQKRRLHGRTWIVLSVRDKGPGLAAGEQRRIFNRFYRGRTGMHAHCGGFGLGLSLVADIVRAHRGRLRAYNAPDGGAVFELWLRAAAGGVK